jgi:hypothetical protein
MWTLRHGYVGDYSSKIGGSAAGQFKYDNYDYYGNYIYPVYPTTIYVFYKNENGEWQTPKDFGYVSSKQESDSVIKNEVIPFIDDLLTRGLISQEDYDWNILDPLNKAVERYFKK